MRWTPEALAAITGGALRQRVDRPIHTAFFDSRQPVQDGLFVPIVAARDGHEFIPSAIAGGASAVLQGRGRPLHPGASVVEVDDPLRALEALAVDARERCPGPVVAITGSNGKTTTRAMITAVIGAAGGRILSTRGNLNNHLGVPLTMVGDPDEPTSMVIELGMSAPGENDHLAALVRPTHAVITSVALEHLEFMGSLAAIARAEAEPIAHIQPGGALLIPGDEPLLLEQVPAIDPPLVHTFAAGDDPLVAVVGVELGERTVATLEVRDPEGGRQRVTVRLQAFGAHNARNAAAALAVGVDLGLDMQAMIAALEATAPVGDRGRVLSIGGRRVIADCYNANPGSMAAALRSLAGLRGGVDGRSGRLVAVLGDMLELGPDEDALHQEIGALCAELELDAVITVGPRVRHLGAAAAAGGIEVAGFDREADPAAIAAAARELSGAGAAILVKGSRGIRLERVIEAMRAAEPHAAE
ncbi:MAG: UDP-N-acetylmuramoyl-tripeptide--D-alanyl-D-alanine ligase [Nannocystaceae bacterium]